MKEAGIYLRNKSFTAWIPLSQGWKITTEGIKKFNNAIVYICAAGETIYISSTYDAIQALYEQLQDATAEAMVMNKTIFVDTDDIQPGMYIYSGKEAKSRKRDFDSMFE